MQIFSAVLLMRLVSASGDGSLCFKRGRTTLRLVRGPLGDKVVLELADEALHRPGAGFAEGADGPATGNVVRDLHQIIRVPLATFAVREAMERLAHPERTFTARRALAA